jgi:hypothetical protein
LAFSAWERFEYLNCLPPLLLFHYIHQILLSVLLSVPEEAALFRKDIRIWIT